MQRPFPSFWHEPTRAGMALLLLSLCLRCALDERALVNTDAEGGVSGGDAQGGVAGASGSLGGSTGTGASAGAGRGGGGPLQGGAAGTTAGGAAGDAEMGGGQGAEGAEAGAVSTGGNAGAGGGGAEAGAAGASGDCSEGAVDCDDLTPRSCQDGALVATRAPCEFACDEGACSGSCSVDALRCQDGVFQRCGTDHEWGEGETCPVTCDAIEGCVAACTEGTIQCVGASAEREHCTDGVFEPLDSCANACLNGDCTGICEPGEVDCQGLTAYQCASNGDWDTTPCLNACLDGLCVACNPGAEQCAVGASLVQRCTDEGTWLTMGSCQGDEIVCGPCVDGDGCNFDGDCASGRCNGGTCRPAPQQGPQQQGGGGPPMGGSQGDPGGGGAGGAL